MATQQPVLAAEEIFHIPLADIQLSKTNPRRDTDEAALEDLAADIKIRDVQQPILVRPITGADAKFELVFGERRYLASRKAGKETIRSMKRAITAEEAQDLQIIENLQREDLTFLDEAAGFKRLYDKRFKETGRHDDALAFVTATVNKKPEFVAQRLKLNDLIADAKEAFREGKLLLGHASELARLRENEQESALKWMLQQHKEVKTVSGWKNTRIIPGVPELRLWIQQNLFLDLSKAPFDTSDTNLNPKMGACAECQFRTGNQPALFGDVKKGDTCTAPPCWQGKRDATLINLANAMARELGVKSILKIGIGHASWNDPKVPVDAYIYYDSGVRIVKQGSECQYTKPGLITWIGQAEDGGSLKPGDGVQVCTKVPDCPTHKKVDSRHERPKKSFEQMADTRIANLQNEQPQRVRGALIRAVIAKAGKERRALSAADNTRFHLIAGQMHRDLYFDRHRDLCKLMGVEPAQDKAHDGKDWRASSLEMFKANPVALMVAMVLMHRYHVGHYCGPDADSLKALLRVYKVDAKAVEKRIKAETAAQIGSIQGTLKKRKKRLAASSKSLRKLGAGAPVNANCTRSL